jgi:hypothetical protein
MRIGLIQSRGIGDIIIALPIADYFLERGDEVHWPIDDRFVAMFKRVKPEVNFIPIARGDGFYYDLPLQRLQALQCERIVTLYSYLKDKPVYNKALSQSLKFDEYKYAIAGVPFARKWQLRINRDLQREEQLKRSLGITGPYICFHGKGSDCEVKFNLRPDWREKYRVIEISEVTDSPFDWIGTLEQASKVVLMDSCFANLVDQLDLKVEKYLILRSAMGFTPVYGNGWTFVRP